MNVQVPQVGRSKQVGLPASPRGWGQGHGTMAAPVMLPLQLLLLLCCLIWDDRIWKLWLGAHLNACLRPPSYPSAAAAPSQTQPCLVWWVTCQTVRSYYQIQACTALDIIWLPAARSTALIKALNFPFTWLLFLTPQNALYINWSMTCLWFIIRDFFGENHLWMQHCSCFLNEVKSDIKTNRVFSVNKCFISKCKKQIPPYLCQVLWVKGSNDPKKNKKNN